MISWKMVSLAVASPPGLLMRSTTARTLESAAAPDLQAQGRIATALTKKEDLEYTLAQFAEGIRNAEIAVDSLLPQ
jgi:hypothetical protein